MRLPSPVAAAVIALALAGCSSLPSLPKLPDFVSGDSVLGFITPYRIDIVQGNVVTKEMAARVRPGLTRAQVRDILGSPVVADAFHADRWDYVFTFKRPGQPEQRRSVVAHFDGNVLKRLDAPELPDEREFVASISSTRAKGVAPKLELTPEQVAALPAPARGAAAAAPNQPQGAVRTYPPLERE